MKPSEYKAYLRLSDAELSRQCDFSAFHGHGHGGQGVNTSDSAVRLVHRPTGLTVTAREERNQLANRKRALKKLREKLKRYSQEPKARIKTEVPTTSKLRRLEEKRRRSEIKQIRNVRFY